MGTAGFPPTRAQRVTDHGDRRRPGIGDESGSHHGFGRQQPENGEEDDATPRKKAKTI
jgi:hypothetical protein